MQYLLPETNPEVDLSNISGIEFIRIEKKKKQIHFLDIVQNLKKFKE